jgi:hypothetical protein
MKCAIPKCKREGELNYATDNRDHWICDRHWVKLSPAELRKKLGIREEEEVQLGAVWEMKQ